MNLGDVVRTLRVPKALGLLAMLAAYQGPLNSDRPPRLAGPA